MPYLLHRIKYFFVYWLQQVDKHSLHSPFLFDLYKFLESDPDIKSQSEIEGYRKTLIESEETIRINSPGNTSTVGKGTLKPVAKIVRKGISRKKYCELLYKLGVYFQAETIIELGTSFGLASMYLASIPESQVYTMEGCKNTMALAEKGFQQLNFKNISPVFGNINETLPELLQDVKTFDLAFIDANHTYDATLYYFDQLIQHSNPNSILVLDDIYWSPDMTLAWNQIKKDERVSVSLDFFQIGIVFMNPDLQKADLFIEL